MHYSPAERLFNEEVRDKRRTANGVHSRVGKRGYVGKMMLPTDLLRGKEKREHKKNGKVRTFNMYQDICDYEYFKGLAPNEQKKVLESLREKHSNDKIRRAWKLNSNSYYKIVHDLGIQTREKTGAYVKKTKLSDEELEVFSKEIISYSGFKQLECEQQYALFQEYLKNLKMTELAELWGTDVMNVYGYNSKFKKKIQAGKLKPIASEDKDLIEMATEKSEGERDEMKNEPIAAAEMVETPIEENASDATVLEENVQNETRTFSNGESVEPVHEPVEPIQQVSAEPEKLQTRSYGTTLSFDGEYSTEQLRKKLLTMVELLEGDGRFYKMNLSLTEVNG